VEFHNDQDVQGVQDCSIEKKGAVKNPSRFSFLLILVTGLLFKSVMPFLEMLVRFQLRLI